MLLKIQAAGTHRKHMAAAQDRAFLVVFPGCCIL